MIKEYALHLQRIAQNNVRCTPAILFLYRMQTVIDEIQYYTQHEKIDLRKIEDGLNLLKVF